MKLTSLGTLLLLFAGAVAQAQEEPAKDDPAKAVEAALTSYVQAFNKQDVKTIGTLWAEDGEHTDRETGERVQGREVILSDLEATFKAHPGIKLTGEVTRVKLVKSDVALAEGITTVSFRDEDPVTTAFSALLIKAEQGWVVSSIEESAVPVPETAYDALKELEWLVGDWQDQGEDVKVHLNVRWAGSQSFLIRSYSVKRGDAEERNGTQIIGWDARAQQFRSWTFNSDGSFGQETWSKNDGDWLLKSTQTLASGEVASGTYVVSPIDPDSYTVRLIGHEIEGEMLPATEPVTIVRVPAEKPVEIKPATGAKPAAETPAPKP